jgi:hypothetical protein
VLGLIWNIEDCKLPTLNQLPTWPPLTYFPPDNAARSHAAATSWEKELQDLTWTFEDGSPRYRHEQWKEIFDQQLKSNPLSIIAASDPLFSLPLAAHEGKWTVWLSKDDLQKRYWTLSQIAVLQGEQKEV